MAEVKIDEQVEPLVREVLLAVVAEDSDRLTSAIKAIVDLPRDDSLATASHLATSIGMYVLHDAYGGRPSPEDVRAVADKLVELESWLNLDADEVARFIDANLNGTLQGLDLEADRVALISHVLAGNLLSSCHRDNEEWWDYLDRAEAAIESAA